jgi:hypothetical protein
VVLTTGIDTLWGSSCEIYDKISPAYRKFLEGLTATFAQVRLPITAAEKGFKLYSDPRGSPNNVGTSLRSIHPVVRTNPVTGWKSLYAVGNHVEHINDVTKDESRRLHDWFLQMIVEEHDTQLRHRWENPYDIGKSFIYAKNGVCLMSSKLYGITARFTIRPSSILLDWAVVRATALLELARSLTSTQTVRLDARRLDRKTFWQTTSRCSIK